MHKRTALNPFVSSLIALSSSLAACGQPEAVPSALSALKAPVVWVVFNHDGQTRNFQAWIDPGDASCPKIHATATLDGVEVPLIDPGHYDPYELWTSICSPPLFSLDPWTPASPGTETTSTLEIRDESKTIAVDIRNLGVPRSLSVVSPASGPIGAGTHVTLAWSPSTDVLDPSRTEVTVGQTYSNPKPPLAAAQVTVAGTNIDFDMPAGVQAGTIDVANDTASIARCEGATRCVDMSMGLVSTEFTLP